MMNVKNDHNNEVDLFVTIYDTKCAMRESLSYLKFLYVTRFAIKCKLELS